MTQAISSTVTIPAYCREKDTGPFLGLSGQEVLGHIVSFTKDDYGVPIMFVRPEGKEARTTVCFGADISAEAESLCTV